MSGQTSPGPVRIALVTGAAQGIGRAIALRLASDGYHVAVNDIELKRDALETLAQEISLVVDERSCLVAVADISDEQRVIELIEYVVKIFGGLDVVSVRFQFSYHPFHSYQNSWSQMQV